MFTTVQRRPGYSQGAMWLNATIPSSLPHPVSLRVVSQSHWVNNDVIYSNAPPGRERRHQSNVSLVVSGPNWLDMDIAPQEGVTIAAWSLRY